MNLILPQNPAFQETLDNIPFFWSTMQKEASGIVHLAADPETGLLRPCTDKEFEEYVFGGEYDERLAIMDDQEIINQCLGLQSDFLSQVLITG